MLLPIAQTLIRSAHTAGIPFFPTTGFACVLLLGCAHAPDGLFGSVFSRGPSWLANATVQAVGQWRRLLRAFCSSRWAWNNSGCWTGAYACFARSTTGPLPGKLPCDRRFFNCHH